MRALVCSRRSAIDAAVAVDQHREEQDQAEEELQPEIADLQHEQAAADGRHQQRAEHGADHRHDAAGEQRAAEHGPRNDGSSHSSPPTAGIAAPSRATHHHARPPRPAGRTARG